MLQKIADLFADGFTAQALVDAIKIILDAIFGYISKEEGYPAE